MLKPDLSEIVKETNDKEPFKESSAQLFLQRWCSVNGKIIPSFYPRSFIKNLNNLIVKTPDGAIYLNIPEDIKPHELIYYVNQLENLFSDSPKRTENLRETAKKMKNASIYIAQRLDCLKTGQQSALNLAEELYGCGELWQNRIAPNEKITTENNSPQLKDLLLSNGETWEIDEWLLGQKNYEIIITRLNKKFKLSNFRPKYIPVIGKELGESYLDELETSRQHYLQLFFDHILPKDSQIWHNPEKPWIYQQDPFYTIQEVVSDKIKKLIQSPELELIAVIYEQAKEETKIKLASIKASEEKDHGDFSKNLEELIKSLKLTRSSGAEKEMIDDFCQWVEELLLKYPADSLAKEKQAVKIKNLIQEAKKNLQQNKDFKEYEYMTEITIKLKNYCSDPPFTKQVSENGLNYYIKKLCIISEKEAEVINYIYSFMQEQNKKNPPDTKTTSYLNELNLGKLPDCTCASDLMSSYLEEAEIKHLKASIPGHAFLLVILTNKKILWINTVNPFSTGEINPKYISGINIEQLITFIKNPSDDGLIMTYNDPEFLKNYAYTSNATRYNNGEIPYVFLEDPKRANSAGTLHNLSIELNLVDNNYDNKTKSQQAYLAAEYSAQFSLKNPSINLILTELASDLNLPEKKKQHAIQAIKLNPRNPTNYFYLGKVFLDENKTDLAKKIFMEGAKFDKDGSLYCMCGGIYGKKQDYNQAIIYFTKALELNPKFNLYKNYLFFTYIKNNQLEQAALIIDKISDIDFHLNPYTYKNASEFPLYTLCYYLLKIHGKIWIKDTYNKLKFW